MAVTVTMSSDMAVTVTMVVMAVTVTMSSDMAVTVTMSSDGSNCHNE